MSSSKKNSPSSNLITNNKAILENNGINEEESLIEFPCEFPIKVMGPALPEFHTAIHKIAASHDEKYDADNTTQNVSKTGKYVSLTIKINAKDKPQLDAIYQEFTSHELVLWAL